MKMIDKLFLKFQLAGIKSPGRLPVFNKRQKSGCSGWFEVPEQVPESPKEERQPIYKTKIIT